MEDVLGSDLHMKGMGKEEAMGFRQDPSPPHPHIVKVKRAYAAVQTPIPGALCHLSMPLSLLTDSFLD